MKMRIIKLWHIQETKCDCGFSFGWPYQDGKTDSFLARKAAHFEERHPRRFAQGGIA